MSRTHRGLTAITRSDRVPPCQISQALDAAPRIIRKYGLDAGELVALELDPQTAMRTVCRRSDDELRLLENQTEQLCRAAIEAAYRSLLEDADVPFVVMPGDGEAYFRQLSDLAAVVEELRGELAAIVDRLPEHTVPAAREASGSTLAPWTGRTTLDPVDHLRSDPRRLVESGRELAEIDACIDSAAAEQSSFLVLEGRSGMGKSALLAEVRKRGAGAGLHVFSARCSELESDFAFSVVRQLFEPAIGALGTYERARVFDGAAGLAARALEVGSAPGSGDECATLHSLYRLATNLSARAPLLLAVDDAHWADAASLRWLAYLLNRLEDLPVLVVLTTRPPRPGSRDELLSTVLAHPGIRTFPLRPARTAR